ncbi:exonuclease/endonuclease/phosphatase family protein [Microlunatus flavus]|uniref:Endonuclease/Exonuclease/phosphatase family protein n=1 Tax=Microlunatus flavus TaxID=1036181 RepID=A0A1H9JJF1_9ACTN|nr:hypothetical protein [Microlunatus flavus]SEQ86917.1 hypothetical protein SAMN05421756_106231 [Microlunatus flavus]
MTTRHHGHRLAATVAAALTLAGLVGVAPAQAAQTTNPNASYLVVYDNNVENMLSPTDCPDTNPDKNDFEKLFAYIKAQPYSPDVFTVQQISNQAKLDALTQRMTTELPGTYKSVIAIANPNSGDTSTGACTKQHQTNAVVYRSDRLTVRSTLTWRSDSPGDQEDSVGPCRNNEGGFQERTENVAVRLTDNLAKKAVIVASVHWPTKKSSNGPLCAGENITEVNDRTAELGTKILTIVGGDTNARVTQGREPWGAKAQKLGFKDGYGFRDACGSASCNAPGTFTDGRRIDFLLSKGGPDITNPVTISRAAAGGRYSDHLALKVSVKY